MTIRNLDRLFEPSSVALIGASDRAGSVGRVVLRNLRDGGFTGGIALVNPKHRTIDGVPCYAGVGDLPQPPDLAIIATPAATVPELVEQLARGGTKAVVILSAGFGGAAGKDLKERILAAARPHLVRLVGPNCVGMLAPAIGLNASFAHLMPVKGTVAFLSQSGAIVTSVIDWAKARNIGFSYLVSMGEMADVDFGDMLDYLAGDSGTSAILLYMEAVTNARKFMSAARRAARLKPVIVIKAGRHGEAARAVASHTGALAGSDAVYDAAFDRAGLLRVFDLDALFEATETLALARKPAGNRLAILTDGGGIGILATDALLDFGGRLAELVPETIARLDAVLPHGWSRGNPIDIIGDAPAQRYVDALTILLEEKNADAILILNCPTAVTSSVDAARAVIDTVKPHDRCILTNWVGDETAQAARRLLIEAGLPTYDTPEHAVRAFSHVVRFHRNQERLMETPPSLPDSFTTDPAAARAIIDRVLQTGRMLLTAPEARAVLRAYGVPTVAEMIAKTPAEARQCAAQMNAPVALKILSPDITHKSDVGGVALRLATPAAVEAAAAAMLARVKAKQPAARVSGFALEPMVDRPLAQELIVGVSEDAQFGPVILFGQGGVAVETIGDSAIALPPLNLKLAHGLMERTRIHRLLRGFRDRPPAALAEIALVLLKVSQLVVDFGEIAELDINPLLADHEGVLALDARIRLQRCHGPAAARLSIRPYPSELEEMVAIADGARFLLRPIRPEDEPQLITAFARLSPQSIRMRFFSTMRELPHSLAARLTQIDYDREMALVLTEPGPAGRQPIYGVVRVAADPDNERAEFAIVVRDDMAGRGLGMLLMGRMLSYAERRGIREVFGDVLAENKRMLDIARRLDFDVAQLSGQPDLVRVTRRTVAT
ncbi:MAG TPA: bifunctional acetate--CoA ligase family protein/GNAT family N-acetyltransferase [Candidatus Acidoferrum sp.]|nr:bifunctional acetate--CoA ligase family protein/GNAT family N-acetyltransferase [Candidatus Acidoferrum sp.]